MSTKRYDNATMEIGGVKIPVTNLEIDFAETEKRLLDGTMGLEFPNHPRNPFALGPTGRDKLSAKFLSNDLYRGGRATFLDGIAGSDKALCECLKPKDARDFTVEDGRGFMPGSWIQGIYRKTNKFSGEQRWTTGWGVLCEKPAKLPPCMSEDGTRSLVFYFLPEGGSGVHVMQLCDAWKIASERPEDQPWIAPEFSALFRKTALEMSRDMIYGSPAFHDENERLPWLGVKYPILENPNALPIKLDLPEHEERLESAPNGDLVFNHVSTIHDMSVYEFSAIPADDNIVPDATVTALTDAEGLPTHWNCDCGHSNDFNVSPRRCGVCRRFKP